MSVYSGDFLGFSIGNTHSSQLNIFRVSNSNRYEDSLIPNFTDSKSAIPGGDSTYYWNTNYTERKFIINIAFDEVHDEDLRCLRQLLSIKYPQKLIFDEAPYKYYMVKCSQQPILKYLAFDQNGVRIYKGEGDIELIAYYPFGIATKKIIIDSGTTQKLYNPGDLPVDLKIYYSVDNLNSLSQIKLLKDESIISQMNFDNFEIQGQDKYICIDMKTHLIEGLDENFEKTGNLYNKFLITGDFFLVPPGRYFIDSNIAFDKIEYLPLYY